MRVRTVVILTGLASALLILAFAMSLSIMQMHDMLKYAMGGTDILPGVPACIPGYNSWDRPCIVDDDRSQMALITTDDFGSEIAMMTLVVRIDVIHHDSDVDRDFVIQTINDAWSRDERRNTEHPVCVLTDEIATESFGVAGTEVHGHVYSFICSMTLDAKIYPLNEDGSQGSQMIVPHSCPPERTAEPIKI
ncbi:MAG: hypothetical protein KC925_00510 [Candidatus Doudnabacteria bacterium]|nr:hypothetical protein [Candidatus Doudnabacteria bacterium]